MRWNFIESSGRRGTFRPLNPSPALRPEVTEPGIYFAQQPVPNIQVSQGCVRSQPVLSLCGSECPCLWGTCKPFLWLLSVFCPGEGSGHLPGRPARCLSVTAGASSFDCWTRGSSFCGSQLLRSAHPCRVLPPRYPSLFSCTLSRAAAALPSSLS